MTTFAESYSAFFSSGLLAATSDEDAHTQTPQRKSASFSSDDDSEVSAAPSSPYDTEMDVDTPTPNAAFALNPAMALASSEERRSLTPTPNQTQPAPRMRTRSNSKVTATAALASISQPRTLRRRRSSLTQSNTASPLNALRSPQSAVGQALHLNSVHSRSRSGSVTQSTTESGIVTRKRSGSVGTSLKGHSAPLPSALPVLPTPIARNRRVTGRRILTTPIPAPRTPPPSAPLPALPSPTDKAHARAQSLPRNINASDADTSSPLSRNVAHILAAVHPTPTSIPHATSARARGLSVSNCGFGGEEHVIQEEER